MPSDGELGATRVVVRSSQTVKRRGLASEVSSRGTGGSNPSPFVELKNQETLSAPYGRLATHIFKVSHFSVRVSVHTAYPEHFRQGACDWLFWCSAGLPPTSSSRPTP